MRFLSRMVGGFAWAAAIAACGGATDSGLFSSANGTSTADASAGTGTSGGTSGDSGKPSKGDDQPDASNANGGNGGDDASTLPDAPDHDAADASVPDPGIRCGATSCDPTQDVCCRDASQQPASLTCEAESQCDGALSIAIHCDDAHDCDVAGSSGDICCLTVGGGQGGTTVLCDMKQNCSDPNTQTWLCDPAGSADQCPQGKTCKASQTSAPGYYLCLQ